MAVPKDERYLKRKSQRNGCPIRSNLPKEWVSSESLRNLLLVSQHVGTFIGIGLAAVIAPDFERTIEGRHIDMRCIAAMISQEVVGLCFVS